MSFFHQEGDDSNLQYDDAAFIYFIASVLSLAAIGLTVSIINTLLSLRTKEDKSLKQDHTFKQKLSNLHKDKTSKKITLSFFIKIILLILVCLTFVYVRGQSKKAQSKLKGFDPYQILGVGRNASLGQIKKAYRKLALFYHPDKNQGNAQAQNKFILISKSYECFTNEQKKVNCFKYGNPDGQQSFRVGIGLPNFFIKVEYQFYVLPIVLFILLGLVPYLMISWNNQTRTVDHNGITISSYNYLFKSLQSNINKFTFLYILASYPELYEDLPAISQKEKQELIEQLKKLPYGEKAVFHQMNDSQLQVVAQVFNYASGKKEYTIPGLHNRVQKYLSRTFEVVKMFLTKEANGGALYNNPQWTIKYLGPPFLDVYMDFQRDYYNRTLMNSPANDNWLYSLDLTPEETQEVRQQVKDNKLPKSLLEILIHENKKKQFLQIVKDNARRQQVKGQLQSWPVFSLQSKLKVQGRQTKEITQVDYAHIYFRIQQKNKTQGYSYLKGYPYPRHDKVYILAMQGKTNDIVFIKEIVMTANKDYVQKVPYRTGVIGQHQINLFVLHQCCRGIDMVSMLKFNVRQLPQQEAEKQVMIHPDDMNMEKLYKSFIEEVLDMQMDPEAGMLSDSDDEEEEEGEGNGNGGENEAEDDGSDSGEEFND